MYCREKGISRSTASISSCSILRENTMGPVVMPGADISAVCGAAGDPC